MGQTASLDVLEDTEYTRPYRNSNPGVVHPKASSIDRLRRFSSRNLKLRRLVIYNKSLLSSFVHIYVPILASFWRYIYFILSCGNVSKDSIRD